MSKRFCRLIVVVSVLSVSHVVTAWVWPEAVKYDSANWFYKKPDFVVNVLWYIKGVSDIMKWFLIYWALCWIGSVYSTKLLIMARFMTWKTGLLALPFFYNYSQDQWVQWTNFCSVIFLFILLFTPVKEKTDGAVIKSIE